MKRFKLTLLSVFALALLVGLNSCDKGNLPTEGDWNLFDSPEWLAPEPDASPVEINGGTLEQPFDICPVEQDVRLYDPNGGDRGGHGKGGDNGDMMGHRKFMPLGWILRQLELDSLQIDQIKGFIFDYRLCIKENVMNLREKEKELLEPFNERRKEIFEAYKNGEITREEAAQALLQLHQEIIEVLSQNNFRVLACEAMKDCRNQLFENIKTILNEEQLVKFEEWLSKMPEVDCERFKR